MLEERIMDCWLVIDQLNTVLSIIDRNGCDEDVITNAIIGIKTLYNNRFEVLFEAFEEVLAENHKTSQEEPSEKRLAYYVSTSDNITTAIMDDVHSTQTTVTFRKDG